MKDENAPGQDNDPQLLTQKILPKLKITKKLKIVKKKSTEKLIKKNENCKKKLKNK